MQSMSNESAKKSEQVFAFRLKWAAIGAIYTLVIIAPVIWVKWPKPEPTAPEIFSNIYAKKIWGSNAVGEGRSGSGSTMESTVVYRAFLQNFMKKHRIASVVDAGCGDWESTQAIDWSGIDYRGYDIVQEVIAKNQKRFSAPNIMFFTADILSENLPEADLLICKHVLQHLPTRDVQKFLPKIQKYKYAIIVNSVERETMSASNRDIKLGEFRPLDLTVDPFFVESEKLLTYWDGENMQQVLYVKR